MHRISVSAVLLAWAAFLAAASAACVPGSDEPVWELARGRDFDHRPVTFLKKGQTTKEQLVEMFGEPFEKGPRTGAVGERWRYLAEFSRTRQKIGLGKFEQDLELRVKELIVELDPQGLLRVVAYSDQEGPRKP